MQELKFIDGRHEIWATGSVASCDYAGMIFSYGYYVAAFVVTVGLVFMVVLGVKLYKKREAQKALEDLELSKSETATFRTQNLDEE